MGAVNAMTSAKRANGKDIARRAELWELKLDHGPADGQVDPAVDRHGTDEGAQRLRIERQLMEVLLRSAPPRGLLVAGEGLVVDHHAPVRELQQQIDGAVDARPRRTRLDRDWDLSLPAGARPSPVDQ